MRPISASEEGRIGSYHFIYDKDGSVRGVTSVYKSYFLIQCADQNQPKRLTVITDESYTKVISYYLEDQSINKEIPGWIRQLVLVSQLLGYEESELKSFYIHENTYGRFSVFLTAEMRARLNSLTDKRNEDFVGRTQVRNKYYRKIGLFDRGTPSPTSDSSESNPELNKAI